jgi:hypothetical protein
LWCEASPREIRHEFTSSNKADALAFEQLATKATSSQVGERGTVCHQAIRVQLDSGCEHVGVDRASNRTSPDWGRGNSRPIEHRPWLWQVTTEPGCCFAERKSVDSLHKGDRVAARVTTKADPTAGAGKHCQVGSAAVGVKWAPPTEVAARPAELDPVTCDEINDRVTQAKLFGVDAR